MNYSYVMRWVNPLGKFFAKWFDSPLARDRFKRENWDDIKKGDCYVNRLDGNGDTYQYSFENKEVGWDLPL